MGKTMYFMIHASDHPEAIPIMQRAYRNAVDPDEPQEQLEMQLGVLGKDARKFQLPGRYPLAPEKSRSWLGDGRLAAILDKPAEPMHGATHEDA